MFRLAMTPYHIIYHKFYSARLPVITTLLRANSTMKDLTQRFTKSPRSAQGISQLRNSSITVPETNRIRWSINHYILDSGSLLDRKIGMSSLRAFSKASSPQGYQSTCTKSTGSQFSNGTYESTDSPKSFSPPE